MRLLSVPWAVCLLSLALTLKIKAARLDDEIGDLRLLVRKQDDSFHMVSLTTNQSIDLWKLEPESYFDFQFSFCGNDAFFVIVTSTGRQIAKRISGEYVPLQFNLSLGDCWHQFTNFENEIYDMELDYIAENLYISTTCGEIHVCNLNSLICSEIYGLRELSLIDLVIYPEKRLLLWAEFLREPTAGDGIRTTDRSSSIYRANMDGSSISLVVNGFTALDYFVLDHQHARIYWEYEEELGLYVFDLLKRQKARYVPKFLSPALWTGKFLLYVSGDIFIWLVPSGDAHEVIVSDVKKEFGNHNVLYNSSAEENYVEIVPQEVCFAKRDHRRSNPCLANNCSHVCALSGPEGASCLCGPNQDLLLDQATCAGRFLLVSTLDGLFRLGLDDQSALENGEFGLNISAPELVSHDPVNGELYWVEQDAEKAQIYRHDSASGKRTLVLEVKFNESRPGPQAIQTLGVDWVTRNIYLAIQHERRIRVCDDNSKLCVEILENFVSETVCNMELLPQIRKIVWVDVSVDGNSVAKVYLNSAGMDGKDEKIIVSYVSNRVTSCPAMAIDHKNMSIYMTSPEPSGAYRVDKFDLQGRKYISAYLGNRNYVPSHMYLSEGDLIWVGRPSHLSPGESTNETDVILKTQMEYAGAIFVYEDYTSWKLPRVTSLTFYGFSPNWMNGSLRERTGENHQCQGVHLLSETGSFRCACPVGTRPMADRLSCKEPAHTIIYGTQAGQVFLKNNSEASPISLNSSVYTFAFAHEETQLLWTNSSGNIYGGVLSSTAAFMKLIRVKEVAQNQSFTANQIEYDFVGDNIFAVDDKGNIWACSRTSGACVRTVKLQEPLNGEVLHFALDPKRGLLYWLVKGGKALFRTHMDGTGDTKSTNFGFQIYAMAVDQSDGLLYLAYQGSSYRLGRPRVIPENRISYFRFASDSLTRLARLSDMPQELKATNGYVFWSSWSASKSTWSIFSCEAKSGNGLKQHVSIANAPWGRIVHFGVMLQHSEHSNVCGGGLCSHICIPTVRGYMRCACPVGFRLRSDGWTCECARADQCDSANNHHRGRKETTVLDSLVIKSLNGHCGQEQFQCLASKECIQMDQACDGRADCKDLSDEDPRCNDICETKNQCSTSCATSPVGPICTCPIDQELADDLANCTLKHAAPTSATTSLSLTTGFVAKTPQHTVPPTQVGVFAPVFGTLAAVLAVICLVLAWKYFQAQKKLRDMTEDEIREFMDGDSSAASLAPNGMDRAMMLPYKAILPPDGIAIGEEILGSGEYGVVHSGVFNGEAVAIKKLKQRVDVEEFKAVLAEMKIMSYLGDHENIVKFFGSDVSQIAHCQITIVTELSPHGDLLHYLWKVRSEGLKVPHYSVEQQFPEHSMVSIRTLNQWCEQIASGMEYLVTKQVIHGDLAARNVLVFNSNVVKIADFGMSKQLYGSGQYTMRNPKKLPWKWGSIELLTFGEFSEASDVWAFGVTAWEIFSLGETPYKKMMRFDTQFIDYLREGNRLPQPAHASRAAFAMLLECWNAEVTSRPNFALLREFFHAQLHNMVQRASTDHVQFSTEETAFASEDAFGYTITSAV